MSLAVESPLVRVERRLGEAHLAHGAAHAPRVEHIPVHAELLEGAVDALLANGTRRVVLLCTQETMKSCPGAPRVEHTLLEGTASGAHTPRGHRAWNTYQSLRNSSRAP